MEATITEIYNNTQTYTAVNEYLARNTALFNLFTDIAANPPTGLTVSSSSIPSPSSSAFQQFYVILAVGNCHLKIKTGTSSSTKLLIYADLLTVEDNTVSSGSMGINIGTTTGYYQFDFNLTLTAYETTDKLYSINFSSSKDSNKKFISMVYTEEKEAGSEDYYWINDFDSTFAIYDVANNVIVYPMVPSNAVVDSMGKYATIETVVCNASGAYLCKLINTFAHSMSIVLTPGTVYPSGTDSYLRVGRAFTLFIKL